ncbi:hypothetical protein IFT48_03150 [Pseudomonas fluorescens]|uniref:hypothetical protein n=1 Tax=Pseudomonas fluorescens TaxID=294 RepID=UPI0019309913|nr:hypothetical protein [Pseudomonas fluorescens]MBD8088965.1 hypothetical protein [Pseudomonas fluorescens]
MRLKTLFTSIPMSQFSQPRQAVLRRVLDEINSYLAPDTFLGDVENLVELHAKAPDALPRALKHVFELGGLPEDVNSWEDVAGVDLYGGWLMDGGDAVEGWKQLHTGMARHLDALAEYVEKVGLHSIVFHMNLRDSRLNLEGAAKIAGALVEHHNHRRDEKGGLERVSIEGFDKPSEDQLFSEDCVCVFWRHYLDPKARSNEKSIEEMVALAQKEFRRRSSGSHDVLDYLLKVLIYNPGLRMLRETGDFDAVIQALDPVLTAINKVVLTEPWVKFTDDEYAVFQRQVFLNLFSPFPHALAQLEVSPGELTGHPEREFVEDKEKPSAWFLPRRTPINQMKGPLQVFGCETDVFAYFKHQELPINLDWVMQGIVDDYIFRNLLVIEGKCDLLDYNLTRIADNLEVNEGVIEALRGYEFDLDKIQLSPKATVGVVVMLLGVGNADGSDSVTAEWFERRLIDHTHYRDKIKADPTMNTLLLKRLRQTPALLTHRNLIWCGFDAKVLSQLETSGDRKLRDDFFAGDLGL